MKTPTLPHCLSAPLCLFMAVVFASAVVPAHGWGPDGHKIIATIAESYMLTTTRTQVKKILQAAEFHDLASAAVWPDEARVTTRRGTGPWHYIGDQDGPFKQKCSLQLPADCPNNSCVIPAIVKNARIVYEARGPAQAWPRGEALAFVAHLVGDVTMPFHASGYKSGFRDVPVMFNGRQKSIHEIWDGELVKRNMYAGPGPHSPRDYAAALVQRAPRQQRSIPGVACLMLMDRKKIGSALMRCAMDWAKEANALVCSVAHPPSFKPGMETAQEYYRAVKGTIDQQLLSAGVRLATLLNILLADE